MVSRKPRLVPRYSRKEILGERLGTGKEQTNRQDREEMAQRLNRRAHGDQEDCPTMRNP